MTSLNRLEPSESSQHLLFAAGEHSSHSGLDHEIEVKADGLAKAFFDKKRKLAEDHPSSDSLADAQGSMPAPSFSSEVDSGISYRLPDSPMKDRVLDEPPYILSSEIGQLEALQTLASYPLKQDGLYLGFAFEFNYHVLARRPAAMAWICDINKRMHDLYQFIGTTIVKSADRQEFLQSFQEELSKKGWHYFGMDDQHAAKNVILHQTSHAFSWLCSDESFIVIQKLYQEGRIRHEYVDLARNPQFFARLKLWATENEKTFDAIYVSNIPEWLTREDTRLITQMKANLLKIMSSDTIFIDAKQQAFESGSPVIRLSSGIQEAQAFPSFATPRRQKKSIPSFLQRAPRAPIESLGYRPKAGAAPQSQFDFSEIK